MRLLVLLGLIACGPTEPEATDDLPPDKVADAYIAELEAEWKEREDRLSAESGWLTLVALTWLDEGENSLGSEPGSFVALPEWSAPASLGTLHREGEVVTLHPAEGSGLMHGDEPVTAPLRLLHDGEEDGPTRITREGLTFYVIERQGKIGIRAKDTRHPAREAFHGIPRFAADRAWRVEATFEPFDEPRKLAFPTAIGTTDEATVPGLLRFEVDGASYTLMPFQDEPSEPMFLVFADQTSGIETYGGGRFLGAEAPKDGVVVLDFNTATNPPCAFTPYATCPLPPQDNRLAVRVEAGEKTPAGH
ncbi:MAG: DUF1684 domain-containing protein [Deltaproteobacteria bacterium]|nr:MAG: DUF1684 domain-containing protein [Deltaproteobacteria bacterium]